MEKGTNLYEKPLKNPSKMKKGIEIMVNIRSLRDSFGVSQYLVANFPVFNFRGVCSAIAWILSWRSDEALPEQNWMTANKPM
jgi:hypothetical protein